MQRLNVKRQKKVSEWSFSRWAKHTRFLVACFMASMPGILTDWPWKSLGSLKVLSLTRHLICLSLTQLLHYFGSGKLYLNARSVRKDKLNVLHY